MHEELNEVSLFDLLVVVAENLKILILVPLAVGILAFGASYLLPQRFTSEAILALPPVPAAQAPTQTQVQMQTPAQAASIMTSPLVLDPIIASMGLAKDAPVSEARLQLVEQIRPLVGRDGMLRLAVTAGTPEQAQTIANKVIDAWLKTTAPGEQDRMDLERRLAYVKTSLESVRRLLDRLTGAEKGGLGEALGKGEVGTSIVALGEMQDRHAADLVTIPRMLQGYARDVVKQPPTLPMEPLAPRKGAIALVATVASLVVMLVWAFLRLAWTRAGQDPRLAQKQARLRAALRKL